jgi:hypothetical protein
MLTITIPPRRSLEELQQYIMIVKKHLAFLEEPICRITMSPILRTTEIREATATFRMLLKERDMLQHF